MIETPNIGDHVRITAAGEHTGVTGKVVEVHRNKMIWIQPDSEFTEGGQGNFELIETHKWEYV